MRRAEIWSESPAPGAAWAATASTARSGTRPTPPFSLPTTTRRPAARTAARFPPATPPSLIHTLPTEQYNQDIVSLGTHAALTAADITRLLRDAISITLLSTVQAVDLRQGWNLITTPVAGQRRSFLVYGGAVAAAGKKYK